MLFSVVYHDPLCSVPTAATTIHTTFSFASGWSYRFYFGVGRTPHEDTPMSTKTRRASSPTRTTRRIRLQIGGISCGSCVSHVRSALEGLPGARVTDVRQGSAVLELQPDMDTRIVVTAIAAAGYEVTDVRSVKTMDDASAAANHGSASGCCCGPHAALEPVAMRRQRDAWTASTIRRTICRG